MKPKTRQTLIGVLGQTAVMVTALFKGFNGTVASVGIIVIGLTAMGDLTDIVKTYIREDDL
jgi:hypothetical protein